MSDEEVTVHRIADRGDPEGGRSGVGGGAARPKVRDQRRDPSTATGNGSLFFWGFTDAATTYNGIRFSIGQPAQPDFAEPAANGAIDIIGLDDLVVGTVRTNGGGSIPEPATLALLGLGLAGLGFSRRKQ